MRETRETSVSTESERAIVESGTKLETLSFRLPIGHQSTKITGTSVKSVVFCAVHILVARSTAKEEKEKSCPNRP
jgi:hypothetical protein